MGRNCTTESMINREIWSWKATQMPGALGPEIQVKDIVHEQHKRFQV